MNEPVRWAEGAGELGAEEQRIFECGLHAAVPPGAKGAVWAALVASLPAAAAASAGAATLSLTALVKPLGLGALLGVVTAGGLAALRHEERPAAAPPALSAAASAKVAPPTPPRAVPLDGGSPEEQARTVAPPQRAAFDGGPATPAVEPSVARGPSQASFPVEPNASLGGATEDRRIAAARALLRAGRPREALGALERIQVDFPNGALAQERETLAIEALLGIGERWAARARASAFLERYPGSPHAVTVRAMLEALD